MFDKTVWLSGQHTGPKVWCFCPTRKLSHQLVIIKDLGIIWQGGLTLTSFSKTLKPLLPLIDGNLHWGKEYQCWCYPNTDVCQYCILCTFSSSFEITKAMTVGHGGNCFRCLREVSGLSIIIIAIKQSPRLTNYAQICVKSLNSLSCFISFEYASVHT